MPPKIARLAGLGAFGAIPAFLALFGLLVWVSAAPRLGGIMPGLSWVSWISLCVVFGALIGTHVYLGHQLLRLSENKPTGL